MAQSGGYRYGRPDAPPCRNKAREVQHHPGMACRVVPCPDGTAPAPACAVPAGGRSSAVDVHQLRAGRTLIRLGPVATQSRAEPLSAVPAVPKPALQSRPLRGVPRGGGHTTPRSAEMPGSDDHSPPTAGYHKSQHRERAERRSNGGPGGAYRSLQSQSATPHERRESSTTTGPPAPRREHRGPPAPQWECRSRSSASSVIPILSGVWRSASETIENARYLIQKPVI